MFRKTRRPTPHFQIPPPFNAVTGEHDDLREYGVYPYCAMMQIAEDDEHEKKVKINVMFIDGHWMDVDTYADVTKGQTF